MVEVKIIAKDESFEPPYTIIETVSISNYGVIREYDSIIGYAPITGYWEKGYRLENGTIIRATTGEPLSW